VEYGSMILIMISELLSGTLRKINSLLTAWRMFAKAN